MRVAALVTAVGFDGDVGVIGLSVEDLDAVGVGCMESCAAFSSQLGGPLDGAGHQGDAAVADDQAAVGVVRAFCALGFSLTGVASLGCWRQRRLLGLAVCDRPYRRVFGRRRASGSRLRAFARFVISPPMQGLGLALACHSRHPGVPFFDRCHC